MKLRVVLPLMCVAICIQVAYSVTRYTMVCAVDAFVRTYVDAYTDPRDGEQYRIYRTVKLYYLDSVSDALDTGYVYMFAENLRYHTAGSKCMPDSCKEYGRYYPYSELERVCPDGWSIATGEQMAISARNIGFRGDTVYIGHWRTIRDVMQAGFHAMPDGIKWNKHTRLMDVPTGFYNKKTMSFSHYGKIGTVWAKSTIADGYEPAVIGFANIGRGLVSDVINSGSFGADNLYPVKCFRVETAHPASMDNRIITFDEFGE